MFTHYQNFQYTKQLERSINFAYSLLVATRIFASDPSKMNKLVAYKSAGEAKLTRMTTSARHVALFSLKQLYVVNT